ncbi:hypothetical protein L3476_07630 [Paenibacillus thiaminolyticus]|uniref:hypothetical protein n=1 Tax=Paenibacillus thiaminolyticus TaxID=49283 RepID=UPI002350DC4D|nr:hypothetical protein [Paenibacillus thiaminolyticus]WCR28598.1 hypothetical protein L3476_07630 [Paenibacillus thiaminolyticus]
MTPRGKTVRYGHYPDGLRRLSAALHSHEGEFLVVTAKPGYELADRSSPTHKGGGGAWSAAKRGVAHTAAYLRNRSEAGAFAHHRPQAIFARIALA